MKRFFKHLRTPADATEIGNANIGVCPVTYNNREMGVFQFDINVRKLSDNKDYYTVDSASVNGYSIIGWSGQPLAVGELVDIFSIDDNNPNFELISTLADEYETKTINGKFVFNRGISIPDFGYTQSEYRINTNTVQTIFPLEYIFDGVRYNAIGFAVGGTGGKNDIVMCNTTENVVKRYSPTTDNYAVSTTEIELKTIEIVDKVVPKFFADWLENNTTIWITDSPFYIYLYQNRAEVNRIGKAPDWLDDVGVLHGVLRDECSLTSPTIIFEAQQVPAFNYVHIPIFGRYYFVLGIDSVTKNLWRMRLNCDVLETYKNQIWALTAVIDRQENDFNENLNDPNVPAEVNDYVELYELENTAGAGFDVHENSETGDMHFIVTTVGGGT